MEATARALHWACPPATAASDGPSGPSRPCPTVNQDGEIKFNTRFPERIKLHVIQFSTARLSADLNTNKADIGNAAELLNGHLWFLQGHGAEGQKMIGVTILHLRKVII